MRTRGTALLQVIALVAAVVAPFEATASTVRPMNLEEMTARAAQIFVGRCAEVESSPDASLGTPVTRSTFEVEEVLKGRPSSRISFRRPGDRGVEAAPDGRPFGVPRIEPGEEVVLFLYGESRLGFSSPVGLGQGRFRVFRGKDGRRYVASDLDNRFLLRGLSAVARERLGELVNRPLPNLLPLETLLDMVHRLRGDGAPVGGGR